MTPVILPHRREQAVLGAGNLALPPGIEGVEMRKGYYNPMRNLAIIVPFLACALFFGGPTAPSPQSTMRAAALEAHEGVTISAQPWTNAESYKEKFHKKSPLAAGVVAIDTTIRNDTDDSMKIDLEQIRLNVTLSEENRQALRSLTPDDVADVVMESGNKDPTASHRLPFPIPSSGPKARDKHWMQVQKEAAEAAVPASIVAPHQSVHGLLYFDLRGQFDLLATAHLYIPDVRALEKNRPLLYFEIDLSK
ncbi:MAG TPA: hypothetical protein VMI32_06735 [Candidatus Solibacter sp.]|nr:hypothetical protein [Candidatus Solibacter sp.]